MGWPTFRCSHRQPKAMPDQSPHNARAAPRFARQWGGDELGESQFRLRMPVNCIRHRK